MLGGKYINLFVFHELNCVSFLGDVKMYICAQLIVNNNSLQLSVTKDLENKYRAGSYTSTRECHDRVAYCLHDYFKSILHFTIKQETFISLWLMPDATPLKQQKIECQVDIIVQ